jgi:hypothetical protein
VRGVLVLGVVAACYRPNAIDACELACGINDTCPLGLTCSFGRCVAEDGDVCTELPPDAPVDPSDDGQLSNGCAFPASFGMRTNLGVFSSSARPYSVTQEQIGQQRFALFQDVDLLRGAIDAPTFSIMHDQGPGTLTYNDPYINPEGTELYALRDPTGSGTTFDLVQVPVAGGGTGIGPAKQLRLLAENSSVLQLDDTPAPGPPTASTLADRRMVLVVATGSTRALIEFEETSPGNAEWRVVERYSFANLGGFFDVMQPSISPDGLRVVFIGLAAGSAIYGMRRNTVGERFAIPAQIIAAEGAARFPVLRSDCSALYFYNLADDRVFRLGPPLT